MMQVVRMSLSALDVFSAYASWVKPRDLGDRYVKMKAWPLFLLLSLFHHVSCLTSSMCCDGWSGSTCLRPCYGSNWKPLLALMTSLTSTEITSPATSLWHISLIRPWRSHKYSLRTLFTQKDWRFDWLSSPWPPLRNPAGITGKLTLSLSSVLIYSNYWWA